MEYVVYFLMIFSVNGNVDTFPVEFPDETTCKEAVLNITTEYAKNPKPNTGGYKTYLCVPIKKM